MTKKITLKQFNSKLNWTLRGILLKNQVSKIECIDVVDFDAFINEFDSIAKDNPEFKESMQDVKRVAQMCKCMCNKNANKYNSGDKNAHNPCIYAHACTTILQKTTLNKVSYYTDNSQKVMGVEVVSPNISNILNCLKNNLHKVEIREVTKQSDSLER